MHKYMYCKLQQFLMLQQQTYSHHTKFYWIQNYNFGVGGAKFLVKMNKKSWYSEINVF
jgi:hypothetical protein